MRLHNQRRLTVAAAALITAPGLYAQASPSGAFDPFPNGSGARYHFDLSRNFFESPDEELAQRKQLVRRLERFAQESPRLLKSPAGLLRALVTEDSLSLEVTRHTTYLELLFNSDTRNDQAPPSANQLLIAGGQAVTAFDSAVAAMPDSTLSRLEAAQPGLRRYRFARERNRGARGQRLTAEGERIYQALVPLATTWGRQLFSQTVAATDFGTVQTSAGSLSVARDFMGLVGDPDPRLRREAYLKNEAGLMKLRETHATILTRTASALTAAARLRRFPDYPTQSYSERYLDRTQVTRMLDRLAAASDVNKRIEQAISAHRGAVFHLDTVHVWDQWLTEPGIPLPRFTIAETSRLVQEAMRPLGQDYARELARLLDPANGRLDLAPGPNRARRQGFSVGLVGFPSMFYQGQFGGYTEDVVTLAHESGHAVQNMLMTGNGVLPRYAWGPGYFTESFAGLCELLVLDHLYRTAPDRSHKIFYLQRLIGQGAEVFKSGWESLVEQQLFDSAASGRELSAEGIEALTQATGSRFSSGFGPGSERKLAWMQPTQFFTRPLYRVSYVYAKLLALRYFDLLQRDPAGFSKRYASLLSNGYDAPPDALLRRFVDTTIDDPDLIDGAARVLESWLGELNALYRE